VPERPSGFASDLQGQVDAKPSPPQGGRGAGSIVVVGRIGAAHGIKGEVRVKSFTAAPLDLTAYGPLTAGDGRCFTIRAARPAGASPDMLVVRFEGVDDRNTAERLNGIDLSVPRERLPEPGRDEFYHADLIGLDAVTLDGAPLGTVIGVPNYGAGDLLEIAPSRGPTLLIPFTRAAVPEIDLAARRVVVDPPVEVEGEGPDAGEAERP
jgi:16S rRNA processing protein RimM